MRLRRREYDTIEGYRSPDIQLAAMQDLVATHGDWSAWSVYEFRTTPTLAAWIGY